MRYRIQFDTLSDEQAAALVGSGDRNLDVFSECLGIRASFRDNAFFLSDCDEDTYRAAKCALNELVRMVQAGRPVTEQNVIYAVTLAKRREEADMLSFGEKIVGRTFSGRPISPKTKGQLVFVEAMEKDPIVFAIGPAGTGKTYLAVVKAVTALKKGDVKRIVLTRPAVEAGENLGFLPGDLKEKVDPYLTPLYDALNSTLGNEQTQKLIERGTIEIAPLAYMRGRTLDDAYVILDEAQNTTGPQMKMFLTRLGFRSRMIITGDITQVDLAPRVKSGLVQAREILQNIKEISFVEMSADDVVRHPLVRKIIERYEESGGTD